MKVLNKIARRGAVFAAVFLGLMISPLFSQAREEKALERDIAIMEKILDRLLNRFEPGIFSAGLSRGVYLPDYGLLFTVGMENQTLRLRLRKLARTSREKLAVELEALEKAQKSLMLQIQQLSGQETQLPDTWQKQLKEVERTIRQKKADLMRSEKRKTDDETEMREWFRKLDRKIVTFLSTYVDRGNYLKQRQKAGVVVFLNESGDEEGLPKARFYSVPVSAIRWHRMGALDEAAFAGKVTIRNVDGEYGEQIGILSSVIKWTLQDFTDERDLWFTPYRVMGFYLEGVGTIYLLRGWFDPAIKVVVTKAGEEKGKRVVNLNVKPASSLKKLEKLKVELVRALGTYGPTLRFLKKEESIFLLIQHASYGSWGGRNLQKSPIPSFIQVRKKDLDAYTAGKISADELMRRAVIR